MSEPEKKPLKSRFTFRVKNPDGRKDLPSTVHVVEYLFDDRLIAREDWVALQQHMFLKAVGSEASEDSRSLFERVFGKTAL